MNIHIAKLYAKTGHFDCLVFAILRVLQHNNPNMIRRNWLILACVVFVSVGYGARSQPTTVLPEYGSRAYSLSTVDMFDERLQEAQARLRNVIAQSMRGPAEDKSTIDHAVALMQAGEYSNALFILREFVRERNNSPFWAQARLFGAEALMVTDQSEEALLWYSESANRAEHDVVARTDSSYALTGAAALFWKSVLLARLGRDEDARQPLQRLVRKWPRERWSDDALFMLGQFDERLLQFDSAIVKYEATAEQYPSGNVSVAALIRAAQCYIIIRQPVEALAQLEKALTYYETWHTGAMWKPEELAPDSTENQQIVFLRSEALNAAGKYEAALRGFDSLMLTWPHSELINRARLGSAWSLLNMGEYSQALLYYNELLESEDAERSAKASAMLYRAVALKKLGRRDQALEILKGLSVRGGYSLLAEAQLELGQLYYEDGQMDDARRILEKAEREARSPFVKVKVLTLLGASALDAGYFTRASTAYQDVLNILTKSSERDIPNMEAFKRESLFKSAIALIGAKEYGAAIERMNQFLSENPADPKLVEARFWLAEAFYGARLLNNASEIYADIVRNYSESERREEAMYALGWTQFRLQQFSQSAATFARLLREYPNSRFTLDVLTRKGDGHYLTKQYQPAANAYRQAARKHKDTPQGEYAAYQLGQALYRLNQLSEAARELDVFLKLYPNSSFAPHAVYALGYMYFQQGKYEAARTEYARIRDVYVHSTLVPRAHFGIADAWYNQDSLETALSVYREVIEAYPRSPWVPEAMRGVQYCLMRLDREDEMTGLVNNYVNEGILDEDIVFSGGKLVDFLPAGDAIKEYKQYIQKNPDSDEVPGLLFKIGERYMQLGVSEGRPEDIAQALEVFTDIVTKYPNTEYAADAVLYQGLASERLNEPDKADAFFASALAQFPRQRAGQRAGFELGRLRENRLDTVGFLEAYRTVAEQQAGSDYGDRCRFRLAAYFIGRVEEDSAAYDSARTHLHHLLSRQDDLGAESNYWMGELYRRDKEYVRAEKYFSNVKKHYAQYEMIYIRSVFNLGECLEAMEMWAEAAEMYRLVVALRGDDEFANAAKLRLTHLEERQ